MTVKLPSACAAFIEQECPSKHRQGLHIQQGTGSPKIFHLNSRSSTESTLPQFYGSLATITFRRYLPIFFNKRPVHRPPSPRSSITSPFSSTTATSLNRERGRKRSDHKYFIGSLRNIQFPFLRLTRLFKNNCSISLRPISDDGGRTLNKSTCIYSPPTSAIRWTKNGNFCKWRSSEWCVWSDFKMTSGWSSRAGRPVEVGVLFRAGKKRRKRNYLVQRCQPPPG